MQVNPSLPRNKPEFTAPNGVNTTINFNSFDLEPDDFPNFYGTSAAAPHAAAAAALVIQGRQTFLSQSTSPQQIKDLLKNTAIDMGVTAGYDPTTGYGFVQPFAAMQTFARPKPEITALVIPAGVTPGTTTFTVTIQGRFLTTDTKVIFDGVEREIIPSSVPDATPSEIQAIIPAFSGDPALQLYNPPISINNNDGGYSEKYYFSFPVKKHVIVKADNKTIKYGERLPAFTSKVTVDGVNTTLSDVGLTTITYATSASTSPLSNVGSYYIQPKLVTPLAADDPLLKQYTYEFQNGLLTIGQLGLNITPIDKTLTYGDKIRNIKFNYVLDPTASLINRAGLITTIETTHLAAIVDSIFALMNGSGATSRALVNGDLENLSILIGNGSGATSRALVNDGSGTMETSHVVDVPNESIDNYIYDPETPPTIGNGSGATSRALVNTGPLVNGTASVVLDNGSGATSRALVNGDGGLTNSTPTGTERTNIAVVISPADLEAASIKTKAVNMLTGITTGNQKVVSAAFVSGNYNITYHLGTLAINKASLVVKANTLYSNNGIVPPYTSTTNYQYRDSTLRYPGPVYTPAPPSSPAPAGKYLIHPSGLVLKA